MANYWSKKLDTYLSFFKNLIPSKKFLLETYQRIKNEIVRDCQRVANYVKRASSAFVKYQIKTPLSKADQCPIDEQPLIIKIDSKKKGYHLHGAAQYDGIVIDSDGDGKNTTDNGRIRSSNEELEGTYFVLYPSKLGLDAKKLKESMMQEAQKKNDYDYYGNNCIDHILRALQASGVKVDKGWISTPREMCQWCDKLCQAGKGRVLNQQEYEKLLEKLPQKAPQKSGVQQGHLSAKIADMIHTEKASEQSPQACENKVTATNTSDLQSLLAERVVSKEGASQNAQVAFVLKQKKASQME